MHGAGNDYIYVNAEKYPVSDPAGLSARLSRRHTGIGSDGLILIKKSLKADFRMQIFNADGSEAMMCGNGCRCVGKYVYEHGLTDKSTVTLETLSGVRTLYLHISGGIVRTVSVDMGKSEMLGPGGSGMPPARPFSAGGRTLLGTAVSMGNPHLVFFADNVEDADVAALGPAFEAHPMFPDRTNVEFAQVLSPGRIRARVWERGSGITMACGTGACAVFAAARARGLCGGKASVVLDGGTIETELRPDGNILMTGPAETVFEGRITVEGTASPASA